MMELLCSAPAPGALLLPLPSPTPGAPYSQRPAPGRLRCRECAAQRSPGSAREGLCVLGAGTSAGLCTRMAALRVGLWRIVVVVFPRRSCPPARLPFPPARRPPLHTLFSLASPAHDDGAALLCARHVQSLLPLSLPSPGLRFSLCGLLRRRSFHTTAWASFSPAWCSGPRHSAALSSPLAFVVLPQA